MKSETFILEFEVIAPTNEYEEIGNKIALRDSGMYSDGKVSTYGLLHLLDHPLHYRISKISCGGFNYTVPAGRKMNYAPMRLPDTRKYDLTNKQAAGTEIAVKILKHKTHPNAYGGRDDYGTLTQLSFPEVYLTRTTKEELSRVYGFTPEGLEQYDLVDVKMIIPQ